MLRDSYMGVLQERSGIHIQEIPSTHSRITISSAVSRYRHLPLISSLVDRKRKSEYLILPGQMQNQTSFVMLVHSLMTGWSRAWYGSGTTLGLRQVRTAWSSKSVIGVLYPISYVMKFPDGGTFGRELSRQVSHSPGLLLPWSCHRKQNGWL